MSRILEIQKELLSERNLPDFKAGDNITVHYKIVEGDKERIQQFKGDVIQKKGVGLGASFTVRKISNGVGVERVFPVNSPNIEKVELNKKGRVRRARIYYLRGLSGKKARIAEKKLAVSSSEE
jgi:large subunit ribosomal protein L19